MVRRAHPPLKHQPPRRIGMRVVLLPSQPHNIIVLSTSSPVGERSELWGGTNDKQSNDKRPGHKPQTTNSNEPNEDTRSEDRGSAPTDRRGFLKAAGVAGASAVAVAGASHGKFGLAPISSAQ